MLRVSENRVLGRIFGPKRDEVTGSGGNHYRGRVETAGTAVPTLPR